MLEAPDEKAPLGKMADASVAVAADDSDRVVVALCAAAGLDPSPENAKEAIARMIKNTVVSYEMGQARAAAEAAFVPPVPPDVG